MFRNYTLWALFRESRLAKMLKVDRDLSLAGKHEAKRPHQFEKSKM